MFNRAVRAPNIQELFLQERVQLDGTVDPCAARPRRGPCGVACRVRSGVTTRPSTAKSSENPANQYNGLVGGNTNFKPETANTSTVGLVFTPTFLPAFNATIDYYNIKINNFITSYGANFILTNCLNSGQPVVSAAWCIVRLTRWERSDGSLWLGTLSYISDGTLNLGELQQEGFDFELNYHVDAGAVGKFDFNLYGNYDLHFKTTPSDGSGTYDCAGYYGPSCGAGRRCGTAYQVDPAGQLHDAAAGTRHVDEVALHRPGEVRTCSQNPLLAGPVEYHRGHRQLKCRATNYIDLGASYLVAKQMTVRVGVNNLSRQGSADHPGVLRHSGARQRQHLSADLRLGRPLYVRQPHRGLLIREGIVDLEGGLRPALLFVDTGALPPPLSGGSMSS